MPAAPITEVLVAPHLDAKGLANCAAAFALCRVEVVDLRSALSKRSKAAWP